MSSTHAWRHSSLLSYDKRTARTLPERCAFQETRLSSLTAHSPIQFSRDISVYCRTRDRVFFTRLCSFALAMPSESGPFCRICHESGPSAVTGGQLVRPCLCRGTLSCAHSDCISQWVNYRARSHGTLPLRSACEICHTDYSLSVCHANPARFLSFSRLAHLCTSTRLNPLCY